MKRLLVALMMAVIVIMIGCATAPKNVSATLPDKVGTVTMLNFPDAIVAYQENLHRVGAEQDGEVEHLESSAEVKQVIGSDVVRFSRITAITGEVSGAVTVLTHKATVKLVAQNPDFENLEGGARLFLDQVERVQMMQVTKVQLQKLAGVVKAATDGDAVVCATGEQASYTYSVFSHGDTEKHIVAVMPVMDSGYFRYLTYTTVARAQERVKNFIKTRGCPAAGDQTGQDNFNLALYSEFARH